MTGSRYDDLPLLNPQGPDEQMLDCLLRETFEYFLRETDPRTGLIADKTQPGSPCSIAVAGMGLSAYIIGVEKKLMSREDAISRVHKILHFLHHSHQGIERDATGLKGFYYHFLEMDTGKRAGNCELSTMDTALLMAGVLSAATYFSGTDKKEDDIREWADQLYSRVDWQWALDDGETICHGWNPETGFLPYRWNDHCSEALILYTLAVGSPTYPVPAAAYGKWTDSRRPPDVHLRFNNLTEPEPVPLETDYSSVIQSDVPIVVQHTRLDSRQAANALISSIAYTE